MSSRGQRIDLRGGGAGLRGVNWWNLCWRKCEVNSPISLTPLGDPYLSAAANALKETFGADPLYIREGGSIPIAALFQRELSLPVVLLGFTPPDDNAHAPNESMDLGNFEGGIRTVIRALDAIAALC